MKKYLLSFLTGTVFLAFAPAEALAATSGYEIDVDLTINGKLVSSPRINARAGEKTTFIEKVGDEERFIEVLATEGQGQIKGKKAILMKFTVGTIKDGQRSILAEPQIMTIEKNRAAIEIGESEGKESINLSVSAERKAL